MGGTIPFLTKGLSTSLNDSTSLHARVYAVNTAGGAFGALLGSFYMIPAYGLPDTMRLTSVINLAAALFFTAYTRLTPRPPVLLGSKLSRRIPAREQRGTDVKKKLSYPKWVLYAVAFSSGFYVMTLENVIVRLVGLSIGNSIYSFSIVVGTFISAIAVGSLVFSRWKTVPAGFLYGNQLAIASSLLIMYPWLDSWPYFYYVIRAALRPNDIGFFC